MMAMRSEIWRTTPRSWLMNNMVRPSSRRSLRNRLMICAWIETSSEATGSSQTRTSGVMASARDRDALTLSAGELMRESPGEIGIKADRFEPLFDVGACIAAAHDTVGDRAFGNRLANAH